MDWTRESNYSILRERIPTETPDGTEASRRPQAQYLTPVFLLRLLDALHADMQQRVLPEVDQILTDRWWNS